MANKGAMAAGGRMVEVAGKAPVGGVAQGNAAATGTGRPRCRLAALALFAMLLVLSACAARMVPPNPSNPIYTVAVLPVYNATNDVGAPEKVRAMFQARLEKRHYSVMPIDEVDRLLRDQMGITLGSQLDMTTPEQVGEVLGVDGLVYGYLLNFDHITTGIYNAKKVRAGFKLVDARSGKAYWARGQGVKSVMTAGRDLGLGVAVAREVQDEKEGLKPYRDIKGIGDIPNLTEWRHTGRVQEAGSAGDAAIFSLGEKLVTKALGVHLSAETNAMLNMIFRSMPVGPGGPSVYMTPARPGPPPVQ